MQNLCSTEIEAEVIVLNFVTQLYSRKEIL